VLVAATLGVFVTGVALLVDGHKSNTLLLLHKATFIVWGAVFAIHFLSYLPRMLRSLRDDWSARHRRAVGGAGLRGMLVGSALGGGLALALVLLPTIDAWQA
jgi:purine-cytosine permease-like protein